MSAATEAFSIAELLDAKIPKDAVSQRDGGGKKLSYLETYYVIDRMNQVFGHLNWSNETLELRQLTTEGKPSYLARVRVSVEVNGKYVFKDGVGFGSDKSGLNPHEMAAKEAESDAFKRAAKNFGISMGLGLYEKTGEYVDEGEAPAVAAKGPAKSAPIGKAPAPVAAQGASEAVPVSPPANRKELEDMITQMSKVVLAKKTKTLTEIKKYLTDTYGESDKTKLTDEQAKGAYAWLRGLL